MVILSLIGSLVGIKIKDLISNQRFQNAADRLAIELREAQFLAVTYQTDIYFRISKEKGSYYSTFTSYEPCAPLKKRTPSELGGVAELFFNQKKVNTLQFTIASSGRIEPVGELKLAAENQAIWLDLRTPLQIKLSHQELKSHPIQLPAYPRV